MPKLRDIAAAAGVSIATVSRVLHDHPGVRPESRQKVLKAAAQLRARQVVAEQALVAVFVTDIKNPYCLEVVRGIEEEALAQGLGVIIGNMNSSARKVQAFLRFVDERKIKRVLVILGGCIDHVYHRLAQERKRHGKVVMIGANSLGLPTVAVDEVAASQKAIKHLLDLGHRRIAIVSGPHTSSTGLNHLQGYMRVLAEAHIPYRAELVLTGDYTAKAGYRAGQKLARLPEPPTAVFCGNDLMALGLMRAMREADLRIPADISVVGYNKIPSLQYGYIEPTSIQVPAFSLGITAMRLLCTPQEFSQNQVLLPTELSLGESCGPAPVAIL